jgi:hypothetical protein
MLPHTKPPTGTQINPLHPLSQGLVCCWLFNEGAGCLANDISGNKNHGRLTNMAPNVQGSGWGGSKFGGGLKFDGVDDYVDCGIQSLYNSQTITMWLNSNGASVDKRIIDGNYWGIYANNTAGGGVDTTLKGTVHDGVAFRPVEWEWSNISQNIWYHIALVWNTNDSNVKLYVNGDLKDTNTGYNGTVGSSSHQLMIGAGYSGTVDFFNGSIDSVRIYNRALSAEEVKTLYLDPFCNMMVRRPSGLYVPAAPVGAIMNQFQGVNLGADLYNGVLA